MHVLLLKEPRDGESGPDPYIKVDALVYGTVFTAVVSYSTPLLMLLHFTANFDRNSFFILIPQELASHGHKATLIPVLSFKFVSLNTLTDMVNSIVTVLNYYLFHQCTYVLLFASYICCLRCLPISAFPTRKTRRSYIYQSKSGGGCEDVLRSRRKKGR